MKVKGSLKICGLLVVVPLSFSIAHADVDAGYEAANGNGQCPLNGNDHGPWGFALCNCTSYVAYRLRLNNVRLGDGSKDDLFSNTWGNSHFSFGDAGAWNDSAKLSAAGIHEDKYPAVGSVAHWNAVGSGPMRFGHVAYVQHIFTHPDDGRLTSFGIMEYNYNAFQYTYRRIGAGRGDGSSVTFLHFEAKGNDANIPGSSTATNVTCVAGLPSTSRPGGASNGSFCWKHNGSDAKCENASAYYYFDYRHCQKYTVSKEYCGAVSSSNPGYTAHLGNWFPEPIDSKAKGNDFATCDSAGSVSRGASREVSGRLPAKRMAFLRKTILND
jgi:surface antigen